MPVGYCSLQTAPVGCNKHSVLHQSLTPNSKTSPLVRHRQADSIRLRLRGAMPVGCYHAQTTPVGCNKRSALHQSLNAKYQRTPLVQAPSRYPPPPRCNARWLLHPTNYPVVTLVVYGRGFSFWVWRLPVRLLFWPVALRRNVPR